MTNRFRLLALCTLLLNVVPAIAAPPIPAADRSRPNIILIMVDDMGYSDIGCYGGEVNTPNIDMLAKGGLRFTQFYNTAKCHTTRAELLTGNYAYQIGDKDMAVRRHLRRGAADGRLPHVDIRKVAPEFASDHARLRSLLRTRRRLLQLLQPGPRGAQRRGRSGP